MKKFFFCSICGIFCLGLVAQETFSKSCWIADTLCSDFKIMDIVEISKASVYKKETFSQWKKRSKQMYDTKNYEILKHFKAKYAKQRAKSKKAYLVSLKESEYVWYAVVSLSTKIKKYSKIEVGQSYRMTLYPVNKKNTMLDFYPFSLIVNGYYILTPIIGWAANLYLTPNLSGLNYIKTDDYAPLTCQYK